MLGRNETVETVVRYICVRVSTSLEARCWIRRVAVTLLSCGVRVRLPLQGEGRGGGVGPRALPSAEVGGGLRQMVGAPRGKRRGSAALQDASRGSEGELLLMPFVERAMQAKTFQSEPRFRNCCCARETSSPQVGCYKSEKARNTIVHRALLLDPKSYFAAAAAAVLFSAPPPRISRSFTSVAPLPRRLRK